jgi:hypothetical protein
MRWAYLLRDGELAALTRHHTVAQRLVDTHVLSVDAMERSPHRHLLTRNLGHTCGVYPDVVEQKLKPGDRLLLVLSVDAMERSPHRHLLTRNLGHTCGVYSDLVEQKLKSGDRLLLSYGPCSTQKPMLLR